MNPEKILKTYWGYDHFRLSQKEVVDSILSGKDTLALLPTGGGKSVCYQVPGLLLPGLTIVISPLISLMKDQVDGLLKRNIAATYLASTLAKDEQNSRITNLQNKVYKFVYVSPEKLKNKLFIDTVHTLDISLIVIDESHCISLWGGDFRPSYLEIPAFISELAKRPVIAALTATATLNTKKEIIAGLKLHTPSIFQSSFKRNISINVLTTGSFAEHELQLLAYLKNNSQPGIIYTSSRKETERLSSRLNQLSKLLRAGRVGCYHAGLPATERQTTQQLFLENKLQLLIATNAFGMGIDKPDISFVIHYHPPATLEGYFQEIGRAGRSGQHAKALLLFNPQHLDIHYGLLAKNMHKKQLSMFEDVQSFIHSPHCRMQTILNYFDEEDETCGMCDRCTSQISPLQKIIFTESIYMNKTINWRATTAALFETPPATILNTSQLAYLAILQPQNRDQLQLVPGIGHGWIKLWSKQFFGREWYNTDVDSTYL